MLFLKSTTGTIAFCEEEKSELSEYFSLVGIRLESIKTYEDYLVARKKASRHFMEWLLLRAEQWPKDNDQYALLKQALFEKEYQN